MESKVHSETETTNIVLKVKDFTKTIQDTPMCYIHVGEDSFTLTLEESDDKLTYIITLTKQTESNYDQRISATMTHPSGASWTLSKALMYADENISCSLMSKEDYRNWATINGDVFKLKVSLTIHVHEDNPDPEFPDSLMPEAIISSVNRVIMEDESTTDFSVRCDTKTFRVHKNFLCARSVVLIN